MENIVDADPGDVTVDIPFVTEEKQPDILPDPEQPVERPKRGRGRPKREGSVEDSCRKKYVVQIPGETPLTIEAESSFDAVKQYLTLKHIIATDHVPVVHEIPEERPRGGE